MRFKINTSLYFVILTCIFFSSCEKYLDQKPNKKLVVPEKLEDYQALLDHNDNMNRKCSDIQEFSADDYFYTDADFNARSEFDRNAYLWMSPAVTERLPNDWSNIYKAIYYSNLVLDGLEKLERTATNADQYNNVKGNALFFRARYCFEALNLWAQNYNEQTASQDLGIPIRENSDMNIISSRSNVRDCYAQVLKDLQNAVSLLPTIPLHVMRASKPAAYGLLARVNLSMHKYDDAILYADSCLQIKNNLIDYSKLNSSASFPFERFNAEVIIHFSNTLNNRMKIDPLLYSTYQANDLRKKLFFSANADNSFNFKGSYDNSTKGFCGIAVDEILLTRAECYARNGQTILALNDLNTLLKTRFDQTFSNVSVQTSDEALTIILKERRKQLLMRGIRWMDLKRLNRSELTKIVVKRNVNGKEYILNPNDLRYALQIPEGIIAVTGMTQNPR